ncbi:hypothetical protein GCM10015535_37570 [Streptomyces gelaticus]|uniref:Uncharacterized protein n=1 Tax=Streptomyces gelaticus TaxID=285446 RepID=A0ABQ2W0B3_9ACTN|nr:hypothetical protein GCM10015535_37570 [Streptomyces gelaticus]
MAVRPVRTVRLILADHDLIMEPGEAAEFDTRLPHWFGPAGESPRGGAQPVRPPRGTRARPGQAPVPGKAIDLTEKARCRDRLPADTVGGRVGSGPGRELQAVTPGDGPSGHSARRRAHVPSARRVADQLCSQ